MAITTNQRNSASQAATDKAAYAPTSVETIRNILLAYIAENGGGGGGGGTAADPTGSLGLTAVNGVLTTYMRSDAAPALDVGIIPTWTGNHTFSKQFIISGRADATIAADQDNWAPTGASTATQIYVDGGVADRNITGLGGGAAGRIIGITNKGTTNNIVIKNSSGSSVAGSQFLLPGDITLPPNTAIELRYDGTASKWRPWGRALSNTGVTAGAYGSATASPTFTVDIAGRLSVAANVTITPAVGSITGLGTGVSTALAAAPDAAGGFATSQNAFVILAACGG